MAAKHRLATTAIVVTALAGALAFTQKLTPGIQSLFAPSNSNPSGGSTASADQTVQSDPLNYMYGTIQVEVVRKAGKISNINMLQAGATNGREAAFPYLVKYAIQAQGSNFGNLSGATMTTDTFKQALDSAISKLK
ncbi:MAG: hypothetical protein RL670_803 [Actinomycetota bacterium]